MATLTIFHSRFQCNFQKLLRFYRVEKIVTWLHGLPAKFLSEKLADIKATGIFNLQLQCSFQKIMCCHRMERISTWLHGLQARLANRKLARIFRTFNSSTIFETLLHYQSKTCYTQKGPVKLIQRVKIAYSFVYSLCQICSTLPFKACICSSTYGCQRILETQF